VSAPTPARWRYAPPVYPVLARLGPVALLTHDVFVALGIAVAALVFAHEVRRRGVRDDRLWYVVAGNDNGYYLDCK